MRIYYHALIIIGAYFSALIIQYIELSYATYIGSRAKKYCLYYHLLSILRQGLLESALLSLSRTHISILVLAISYMFIALYKIMKNILILLGIIKENRYDTNMINNIHKIIIKHRKHRLSVLKILTKQKERIDFKITLSDARKIQSLIDEKARISKIHYYISSERIYGIEILRYNQD